jgi:hypothetical protein
MAGNFKIQTQTVTADFRYNNIVEKNAAVRYKSLQYEIAQSILFHEQTTFKRLETIKRRRCVESRRQNE